MQAFVVDQADGGRDETTQEPCVPCVGTDPRPRQRWQARLYAPGAEDKFRILESPPCSQMPRPPSEGDGPGLRQANETRPTRGRCR